MYLFRSIPHEGDEARARVKTGPYHPGHDGGSFER